MTDIDNNSSNGNISEYLTLCARLPIASIKRCAFDWASLQRQIDTSFGWGSSGVPRKLTSVISVKELVSGVSNNNKTFTVGFLRNSQTDAFKECMVITFLHTLISVS